MEYTTIILSIVLIIVSGYFHALETALVSINDKRIKMLADSGDRKAQRMNRFLQNIPFKVSALKTGQLLSSFSAIALVELTFFHRFFLFWNERYSIFLSAFLSFVIILLIVTFIMLIGGKFVPQRIGFKKNEELINSSMAGINRVSVFLTPMVKLSTFISNMISKAFGVNPYELNSEITEEEIRLMVDAGEERGTIDEDEKEMINNIFEFDTKTAEDIATHRTDITAISVNADFEDIKAIINEEKYSRIPVYEENIDKIVGIIHIKDLARYVINNNTDVNGENFDLRKIMMEPYFVPFSKKTDELFEEMQKMKNHLAVVIDEYGGTVGIV
ncbi:MAG: HlyC/CorC family transporter, partial [Firmicutes bacterium]|nr:HlyC/CorC family transporter [Bacillota bacterium]